MRTYTADEVDAMIGKALARERERVAQQEGPVPIADNTYSYAKSLAEAIFKQHFASDEHYSSGRIVWGVNDTVIGILTQIDNMVADMVRRSASKPLTNEMITAGARALCKQMAEACGVDAGDQWRFYADTFKEDAKAVLEAVHAKGDTYPQPAQPSKPLTDEQWQSIADTLGCIITRGQKDAIEATIGIKGDA